jgi:type II secretory ATPase GspE/PulE/Tfp pilus assembly ATPase PilB-like protein
VRAIDLAKAQLSGAALALLPAEFCERNRVIPLRVEDDILSVGFCDPSNLRLIDEVQFIARHRVQPYLVGERALENALAMHYRGANAEVNRPATIGGVVAEIENHSGARWVSFDRATAGSPAPPESLEELRGRLAELQAVLERDEMVIRKLLRLLIDKGIIEREQLMAFLQGQ